MKAGTIGVVWCLIYTTMKSLIAFLILNIAVAILHAQTTMPSSGIVNGAATYLPKPDYPKVPIDVCTSGKVSVEVLIGINGRVKKALAISGNHFLKNSAVKAARRARFRWPIDAPPTERRGIVVYNFPPSKGCKS